MVNEGKEFLGGIDIIIHALGGGYGFKEPLLSWEQFTMLHQVNFSAAAEINRLLIPEMSQRQAGNVVHICSVSSQEATGSVGYNTIKAHLGCKSPKEETHRVHALREAIGPDVNLMIDLNGGYDALQAMEAAKLWEPFNLYWLEEPVGACEIESLANLQNKVSTPIAAGENEFRLHGFKNLFDKNAVNVAMPDIGRVGGIQETRNICALAQSFGILVSPHNYSSGILLAATIQLMASVPNTHLLEIDTSDNAIYQELLIEPLEIKNSFVKVPKFPGLGVKLDQKILEKYSVN